MLRGMRRRLALVGLVLCATGVWGQTAAGVVLDVSLSVEQRQKFITELTDHESYPVISYQSRREGAELSIWPVLTKYEALVKSGSKVVKKGADYLRTLR